jgi:hypothetical protein
VSYCLDFFQPAVTNESGVKLRSERRIDAVSSLIVSSDPQAINTSIVNVNVVRKVNFVRCIDFSLNPAPIVWDEL